MALDLTIWRKHGACRGADDPSVFFSELVRDQAVAIAVCAGCPVKLPCKAWAVEYHEYGIWGGTTERERDRIRRQLQKKPRATRAASATSSVGTG